jgi:hypothetical protein
MPILETDWTVECPGRKERQFLPNQGALAKEWAAKMQCSKVSRCQQKKPCKKQIYIVEHGKFIEARVECTCPASKKAAAKKK